MKLSAFYKFSCVRTHRHTCIFASRIADIIKIVTDNKGHILLSLLDYDNRSIVICTSCLP